MAQYRYGGTEPVPDGDTILRPLDVREFEEHPGAPWELADPGDEPLPLDVPPGDTPADEPSAKSSGKGEK